MSASLALAASLSDLVVKSAQADNLPVPVFSSELRVKTFNWNGYYGGAVGTMNKLKPGHDWSGSATSFEGKGKFAGFILGANRTIRPGIFRSGNETPLIKKIVYGIEGDVTYAELSAENSNISLDTNFLITLRARVGIPIYGNLIYATAGPGLIGLNSHSPLLVTGKTEVQTGIFAGAGYETALARAVTGRFEYLYGHLPQASNAGLKRVHLIRAGILFHLNR